MAERTSFLEEILELLEHPSTEPEGIALIGKVPVTEDAPIVYEKLRTPGRTAHDYNRYLLALGQLNHTAAANHIEAYFLQGKTRDAAIIALLLIDPIRATGPLEEYAAHDPAKGAQLAGVRLLEHYEQHGMDGISRRVDAIPQKLVDEIPQRLKIPSELNWFLEHYTRRT